MDSKQFREAAMASIDEITNYYDTIEDRNVLSSVEPGYLRPLLPSSAPLDPEPYSAIRADMTAKILPGITHWQSPRFMAFFPCLSSYPAMLAEMYSNAFNGAHFNWICSPAVTELETVVLDWMAKAMGLPSCFLSYSDDDDDGVADEKRKEKNANASGGMKGGGVIHGTASEAILTVMTAARDKYLREKMDGFPGTEDEKEDEEWRIRRGLVALGSQMAHSSTKKAAQILGVRFLTVPVRKEDNYAVKGDNLRATLASCRARGLEPFYLTATFGTTDVCAVDDMSEIAAVLRSDDDSSPWVHVDAAYAGSALICPEHQDSGVMPSAALATFHSFNFNPHKWLLTNFDCSALWVRSRAWLVESLSVQPPYLRNTFSESGLVTDYRDWQIPLGRRFRSLKLWFVLRSYGLNGLRAHIRKGIRLGEVMGEMLSSRRDLFEVVAGPSYALVVFRVVGKDDGDRSERGKTVYEGVNGQGEIYLTSTMLDGVFCIRVCTGVAKLEEEHVKRAFEILVKETEGVMGKS